MGRKSKKEPVAGNAPPIAEAEPENRPLKEFGCLKLIEPLAIAKDKDQIEGNLGSVPWLWLEKIAAVVVNLLSDILGSFGATTKRLERLSLKENSALAGMRIMISCEQEIPDELWGKAKSMSFLLLRKLQTSINDEQMTMFERDTVESGFKEIFNRALAASIQSLGGTEV